MKFYELCDFPIFWEGTVQKKKSQTGHCSSPSNVVQTPGAQDSPNRLSYLKTLGYFLMVLWGFFHHLLLGYLLTCSVVSLPCTRNNPILNSYCACSLYPTAIACSNPHCCQQQPLILGVQGSSLHPMCFVGLVIRLLTHTVGITGVIPLGAQVLIRSAAVIQAQVCQPLHSPSIHLYTAVHRDQFLALPFTCNISTTFSAGGAWVKYSMLGSTSGLQQKTLLVIQCLPKGITYHCTFTTMLPTVVFWQFAGSCHMLLLDSIHSSAISITKPSSLLCPQSKSLVTDRAAVFLFTRISPAFCCFLALFFWGKVCSVAELSWVFIMSTATKLSNKYGCCHCRESIFHSWLVFDDTELENLNTVLCLIQP